MSINLRHSSSWSVLSSVTVHAALLAVVVWLSEPLTVGTQTANTITAKLVMMSGKPADQETSSTQAKIKAATTNTTSNAIRPANPIKLITSSTKAKRATTWINEQKEPALENKQQTQREGKPAIQKIEKVVLSDSALVKGEKKLELKLKIEPEIEVLVSKTEGKTPVAEKPLAQSNQIVVKVPEPTSNKAELAHVAKLPTSKETQTKAAAATNVVGNAKKAEGTNSAGSEATAEAIWSAPSGEAIAFGEANIRVKKMTPPKYPHYAILQRKTGTAIVAIELNDNGRVKTSKLHESSAHKILDKAVLHAARKWRFYPPVPMGEVLVPVRFELECSSNACTPKQVQQG